MTGDDRQDPGQDPDLESENEGTGIPEFPYEPDVEDEVEAHAEQDTGEDKPWCIGFA